MRVRNEFMLVGEFVVYVGGEIRQFVEFFVNLIWVACFYEERMKLIHVAMEDPC